MKLLKANGENAQVSYNPELKAWIIASKNVGMLVRTKSEIAKYGEDRYSFAKKIALVWFNKLEDLEKAG